MASSFFNNTKLNFFFRVLVDGVLMPASLLLLGPKSINMHNDIKTIFCFRFTFFATLILKNQQRIICGLWLETVQGVVIFM